MRHYLAMLFAVLIFAIPWMAVNYPEESRQIWSGIKGAYQMAAVFLSHKPKTVEEIKSKYDNVVPNGKKKVKILLVPGHEPFVGGAEYGSLKERELTVEVAKNLQSYIQGNNRFEVYVTRDADSWYPIFHEYFKNSWDDISTWQKLHKEEILNLRRLGKFQTVTPSVEHISVPDDIALRLYGIHKWANDNDIDIILHLHFNDYPRRARSIPGEYSGFSIYVPEKQYFNSSSTKALADNIYARLKKYNAVSDLPGESEGIVEDQDLIAVGAYNSVNAPSMLIEYGYLYEPQFANAELRDKALRDISFQTYLGILDFFDPNNPVNIAGSLDTLILPHEWQGSVSGGKSQAEDVFALQTALLLEGEYPPMEKTKNDCPRTGTLGPCTKKALDSFQKKNGITGEYGYAGQKTLDVLSKKYSGESQPSIPGGN